LQSNFEQVTSIVCIFLWPGVVSIMLDKEVLKSTFQLILTCNSSDKCVPEIILVGLWCIYSVFLACGVHCTVSSGPPSLQSVNMSESEYQNVACQVV
jgi:hypothetical protein